MFATLLCALLAVPAANKVPSNPSALHGPKALVELAPKFELDGVLMPSIHSVAGLPKWGSKSVPGTLQFNVVSTTKELSNWMKACNAKHCETKSFSVIYHSVAGVETKRVNIYNLEPTAEVVSPARAGQPVHTRMTMKYKSIEFKTEAQAK